MGKDHLLVRAAVSAALVALVVALSLALLASSAAAHALLVRSSPGVDATVAQSPAQILLTFSEPVDPTLSKVQVFDAHGRTVSGVSRSHPVTGNQLCRRRRSRRPQIRDEIRNREINFMTDG